MVVVQPHQPLPTRAVAILHPPELAGEEIRRRRRPSAPLAGDDEEPSSALDPLSESGPSGPTGKGPVVQDHYVALGQSLGSGELSGGPELEGLLLGDLQGVPHV